MEKIGTKYYLFYAELFRDPRAPGYWTGVAYADSPLGPWKKDPRGQVFQAGHLAVFNGPDGRKWFSYRVEDRDKGRGLLAIDPIGLNAQGRVETHVPSERPQTVSLTQTAHEAATPRPGPTVARAGTDFDLQGFIDGEVKAGRKTIVIPPGRCRVTPHNREHLVLRDLPDVTLSADGVEMVCTQTPRARTPPSRTFRQGPWPCRPGASCAWCTAVGSTMTAASIGSASSGERHRGRTGVGTGRLALLGGVEVGRRARRRLPVTVIEACVRRDVALAVEVHHVGDRGQVVSPLEIKRK